MDVAPKFNAIDGSSPRVRGTGFKRANGKTKAGFIPACAGNRMYCSFPVGLAQVHPRVCGEQPIAIAIWLPASGSSPRVRGTANMPAENNRNSRFIPACAGNSILRIRHCH